MAKTFFQLFGIEDGFAQVEFAGKTDMELFLAAAHNNNVEIPVSMWPSLRVQYYQNMYEDILNRPGRIFPGVQDAIEMLAGHPEFHLALGTGNFQLTAYLKIAHFGLGCFFPVGGFGEHGPTRELLLQHAISEAIQAYGSIRRTIVIGDTPLDIQGAHQNGLKCLSVATGSYSVASLWEHQADAVIETFEDRQRLMEALYRITE